MWNRASAGTKATGTMCLLILIQRPDRQYPLLVASNRDEDRDRKTSPPGLFVGARLRMLSPRDRLAGGTWLAVNQRGMFAGITNVAGAVPEPLPTTRGALPHLALDEDDLDGAANAVRVAVAAAPYNAFQLLISDQGRTRVLRYQDGALTEGDMADTVLVVSNEHRPGQLQLPGVSSALAEGLSAAERLAVLRPLLLDRGEVSGHRILKKGKDYGTVQSSLIAVPRVDMRRLVWDYAGGPPDETEYRSYGNLGKRLAT